MSGQIPVIPKTPYQHKPFKRGVPLSPAPILLSFLDGLPPKRLVRLPIVLARGVVGYSLRGARVGTAVDAPVVNIDDTALGIGVADHARRRGDMLWLEGYWMKRADELESGYIMRVVHVHADPAPDHGCVEIAED